MQFHHSHIVSVLPHEINAMTNDYHCSNPLPPCSIQVYEKTTKDIIAKVMGGFNGTVFAYGQTSSGKTHTMLGNEAEPGIVPLAVKAIFDHIEATQEREFLLRVAYMEVRRLAILTTRC